VLKPALYTVCVIFAGDGGGHCSYFSSSFLAQTIQMTFVEG